MQNLGDFALSTVVYCKFTTYRPSTGANFALAGTPAISIYKDNSVTQSTSGVTLAADFDSVTGLNHVTIDTSSDGTFYSAGSFFQVVITTGTVDSVSVVGSVVGCFTLNAVSSLRPTTAARTLDVTAAGNAGIDWGNVENPTTAQNLSGTNIDVDQVVASVSGAVGSVTGAVGSVTGNVGGNVVGSVASVTGAVGSVTGAVGSVTGNVGGNVVGTVASVVGAVGSVTGNVGGNVVGTVASVVGAVGSVTGNVGGNVVGTVASVVGAVGSVTGNVGGNVTGSVGDLLALAGSASSAENLRDSSQGIIPGTAATGTLSTTVMTSDLTGYLDNELIGRVVVWTGGDANGQASEITDYAATDGTVTYTAITTAPANGDTFVII